MQVGGGWVRVLVLWREVSLTVAACQLECVIGFGAERSIDFLLTLLEMVAPVPPGLAQFL